MCGITGLLSRFVCSDAGAEKIVSAMTERLTPRGPDDGGVWLDSDAGIALGHRRLRIIDLSAAGEQPMHSACGRYVLAYNGEIYNFVELRQDLEKRGAQFRGHSDTEVLLHAFSVYGVEAALRQANGMFALALWDRHEHELYLARDRIGEKPLYYGWHNKHFLFASELKALAAFAEFKPTVSQAALSLYLRHNHVPDPYSIFAGINKLPPGTYLRVNLEHPGADNAAIPYWSFTQCVEASRLEPFTGSDEQAVERVSDTLGEAVSKRMLADVPLGAFLSGGIDSSLIVALMQARSETPVHSFSIGFDVESYNEAPYAAEVAAALGTSHTEFYVSSSEARATIPRLAGIYDEPFSDSSQIPTLLLCELARAHVTVAMTGDAGDELFAGYTRYGLGEALWQRGRRVPSALRVAMAASIKALSTARWDQLFTLAQPLLPSRARQPMPGDKLHKLARLLRSDEPMEMYKSLISLWQDPSALMPTVAEPAGVLAYAGQLPQGLSLVERMMCLDTLQYLPGDILTKVDRAAMAVSLETRIPFLDPAVIALAWRLPAHMKVRDGDGKWVLREVLAQHIPRHLFERPKMGFGVPIDQWLRGPLREWAGDLLSAERIRSAGYFVPERITNAWRAHLQGSENLQHLLWTILMFEAWREHWMQ